MDRLLPARWAMVAVLWAAAGAWAAGEGTQATPATAVAPPDPIAEAKRQFEAIRNQRREFVSDAELKLNVAPPTLPTDQPEPRRLGAAASPDAPKADAQKSWLLDAMRQPGKTDGKNGRRGDDEAATTDDAGLREKPAESAEPNPSDSRAHAHAAPVVDPLRDFLAGWMTPADYALLVKPTKDRAGTTQATDFTAGLAPLAMMGNRSASETRTGAEGSLAPADLAPRENPYLKTSQSSPTAFGTASGSIPTFNGALSEIKPPTPAGARSPDYTNPPQPVTPPALPDRLKPSDDKKYFPQLKRF